MRCGPLTHNARHMRSLARVGLVLWMSSSTHSTRRLGWAGNCVTRTPCPLECSHHRHSHLSPRVECLLLAAKRQKHSTLFTKQALFGGHTPFTSRVDDERQGKMVRFRTTVANLRQGDG